MKFPKCKKCKSEDIQDSLCRDAFDVHYDFTCNTCWNIWRE